MPSIQDVRDKLTGAIQVLSKPNELRGRIGYMSGTTRVIGVPGLPNKVYVTLEDNSRTTVVQAIHVSSARTWNMPVVLKRLPSGEYYIDSPDIGAALAVMSSIAPGMFVAPHSHRFGLGLPDYVEGLRFEPLTVKRGRDQTLSVRVDPGIYELYGTQIFFPGDELDITSYQPSTGTHCWLKIGIDIALNQLTAVAGDEVDAGTRLLDEDLASIDFGVNIPLGGYDYSGNETEVGNIFKFRDTRSFIAAGIQKQGVLGTFSNIGADHSFVYRKSSDNLWYTASTTATGPVLIGPERGILLLDVLAGGIGIIHIAGLISGFSSLTAGSDCWVSGGSITQTKPAPASGGAQICLWKLGYAYNTTTVVSQPSALYFMKRASLTNGSTLTIEHYADTAPYIREVSAYMAGSPDTPLDIDGWSSTQACILVRYDDGAGSDPTIKTTFKNNTGSTISDLVVVVKLP